MSGRNILILVLLFAALAVNGCKREEQPAPVVSAKPLPTKMILAEAIEPTLIELPNQALPLWRQTAAGRPALAILAQDPYLLPIPAEKLAEVKQLLTEAPDDQLIRRTSHLTPDTLLLPQMAVSAAIAAGFFSEVVWVFPSTSTIENLSVDAFREQLVAAGFASKEEAEDMKLDQGILHGTLRGIPFRMVHPQALPRIDAPLVLHIDPTFFQPIYKGEIKTPLYAILTKTLASLRAQEWKVAAVTIVRPSPEINLPLATRFVADDLASMLRQPDILLQTMPEIWELRGKALYLENFMQKEEIRRLYLEMERKAPKDPAVKYALYGFERQNNHPDKALAYLKEAVTLDPVYAYEYVSLAGVAQERQRPEKSVQMLQLAEAALPADPNIAIALARTLINMGHGDAAKALIQKLKDLPWSPVYFPETIAQLQTMSEAVGE